MPADPAVVPVVGSTSWQALVDHADLQAGQRILINGAGGVVVNATVGIPAPSDTDRGVRDIDMYVRWAVVVV